jgi:hypothetical protein
MQQDQLKIIHFIKTEQKVVLDEQTDEFQQQCYIAQKRRMCKIIKDLPLGVTAYMFQEDSPEGESYIEDVVSKFKKINLYSVRNTGEEDDPINEDFWYIKLTIKEDKETQNPYVYINYIQSVTESEERKYPEVKLANIMEIIKRITPIVKCRRIVLQDDAVFPCDNQDKYGLKAMYLRALDTTRTDFSKISIYNNHGFTATKFKSEDLESCIKSLRSLKCRDLLETSEKIKKILTRIDQKEINYDIYKMIISPSPTNPKEKLDINYTDVKQTSYSSICREYISNLDKLIVFLNKGEQHLDKSIYEFYQKLCNLKQGERDKFQETPTCCDLRKDFLACLRNSVNSNVIIVKGSRGKIQQGDKCIQLDSPKSLKNQPDSPTSLKNQLDSFENKNEHPIFQNTCSVEIPTQYKREQAGTPIIITRLFNLFNGTFEKIKNMYTEMEYIIS